MKLVCLIAFFSVSAFAQVKMRDVGVIGLASHDMFTWDRVNEVNLENGRLDLSTIFDYEDGTRWEKGGNPKNAENSPVWTITKSLVEFYKRELKKSTSDQARIKTVQHFHHMVKESFERLSGLDFPTTGVDADVTNTEQAVMRGLHDILPGKAKTFRGRFYPIKEFKLTNFIFAKFRMNEKELDQPIAYYDGDYDEEYKAIPIPFSKKKINLKQVDGDYIAKFSPYTQESFLAELTRVGRGEVHISELYFIHHLSELFQKGICQKNNKWIQNHIPCL